MSASQSNLDHYGYDVVVALAQVGVNECLKSIHLSREAPLRYFASFAAGAAELITWNELLQKTNNINPFDIENGANSNTSTPLQELIASGLQFVIESQIGPYTLPIFERDIVSFADEGALASFTLFHKRFVVGEVVAPTSPGAGSVWRSAMQSRENPWFFTVEARVVTTPLDNPDDWPKDIRALAEKYPSFTVRLVAFQLEDAQALALPAIPDLKAGGPLEQALKSALLPLDAKDMTELGANVIGYWTQPSPADLSVVTALAPVVAPYLNDWNGEWNGPPPTPVVNPTREQANASSLNLLCAVDNDQLPAVRTLRWNWLRPQATQQYHGLIAVSASTFLKSLRQQLERPAYLACWEPIVDLHGNAYVTVNQGGNSAVTVSDSSLIYNFTKSASDQNNGAEVKLTTHFLMIVALAPAGAHNRNYAAVEIYQSQLFEIDVTAAGQKTFTPVIEITRKQVLPLGVDESGRLVVQTNGPPDEVLNFSQPFNIVQTFGPNYFWIEEIVGQSPFSTAEKYITPQKIEPNVISNFFFPFGEAFSFANVGLSNSFDLYGHVTFLAGASR